MQSIVLVNIVKMLLKTPPPPSLLYCDWSAKMTGLCSSLRLYLMLDGIKIQRIMLYMFSPQRDTRGGRGRCLLEVSSPSAHNPSACSYPAWADLPAKTRTASTSMSGPLTYVYVDLSVTPSLLSIFWRKSTTFGVVQMLSSRMVNLQ